MSAGKYDINALEIADLVQFLRNVGSASVTREIIESDIASGCPVNPDGTVNLLQYTAWLVRRVR